LTEITVFNYAIPKCPLCGRQSSLSDGGLFYVEAPIVRKSVREFYDAEDEESQNYMACRCGLFYVSHYLTPPRIDRLYKMGEYRQAMNGETAGASIEKDDRSNAGRIAPMLFEHVASARSVLDVGCSSGVLLRMVGQHYRARMMGVEPNIYLRDGLNMPNVGDISELQEDDKYDLVIISHVLEHLIDPVGMLTQVRRHMTPDGRIFVQVPIMMPGLPHPLMFTDAAAVLLLVKTGFVVEYTDNKYHYSAIARLG